MKEEKLAHEERDGRREKKNEINGSVVVVRELRLGKD